jgi:DNA helicase-2/ATP-dependent DNA helicase PcrA
MDILKGLNKEQLEAVKHEDGPVLVMAGAGSGKTKVLTSRIVNLINNGVRDWQILAITFTNKAANEMRERVYNMVGEASSFIGTFHSFGLRIIRENNELLNLNNNFTIIDSDDVLSVIKKILKEMDLCPKQYSPYYVRNKISFIKNQMLSDDELVRLFNTPMDKTVLEIYYKYNEKLENSSSVDFDDLLLLPVKLFCENKKVLEHYQNKYQYILIDEYQDTNPVQYKLSVMLAEKHNNIFVVGDMNQSIYAFRQADYRNLINFENDFKDCKVIKLEHNYRSTNTILNAANNVIKNNKERKDLELYSDKGEGVKIKYIRSYDEKHEVALIIDEVNALINMGYNYNEIAVLYRTNAQSRVVEEVFLGKGIPCKVIGSYFFIERKEIKDLIAYLRIVYNQDDEVAFRRIINVPKRGIGEASLKVIEENAIANNTSLFASLATKKELEFRDIILKIIERADNLSLTELIDEVLETSGILEEYDSRRLEDEIRLDNLQEFKSITASYEERTGSVNLGDFLEEIALISDVAQHKTDGNEVTLMTLHSAKGLEFKAVFLIGMEESIFPHVMSLMENNLEEERRLCYVGITRAKERLFISNTKRRLIYGKEQMNLPSRFIDEIDEQYIEQPNGKMLEPKMINKEKMFTDKNDDIIKGSIISHEIHGTGVVIKDDNHLIEVAFKSGVKKLMKNHKSITKVS